METFKPSTFKPEEIGLGGKQVVMKAVVAFPIGLAARCYTAFVLQNLWGWFVVPAVHAPAIGFWGSFGLLIVLDLLREGGLDPTEKELWRGAYTLLEACIPEDRTEWVDGELKAGASGLRAWIEGVSVVSGKLASNTLLLGTGFVIHLLS